MEDGYVWVYYALGDGGLIKSEQFNEEYKIVVNY